MANFPLCSVSDLLSSHTYPLAQITFAPRNARLETQADHTRSKTASVLLIAQADATATPIASAYATAQSLSMSLLLASSLVAQPRNCFVSLILSPVPPFISCSICDPLTYPSFCAQATVCVIRLLTQLSHLVISYLSNALCLPVG